MEKNLSLVKTTFNELPNNIEAEQSVIGSVLLSNEIFDEVNTIISNKNFYDPMHQKIFSAIESLIYKGMLANPITLKNYFENEKDEINVPEYLVKITKFSTSARQAIEYSKIIYDMYVRRELIKISENTIDTAKLKDLNVSGQNIIENSEKLLFDLAEKGSFNSSLVKFDEALKFTIEMASNAYKNEEGIVGVPTGLRDLDDRLGGLHKSDLCKPPSLLSRSVRPVGTPTIPSSFLYAFEAISIVCFIASSNFISDELKFPFSAKSNKVFSVSSIIVLPSLSKSFDFAV